MILDNKKKVRIESKNSQRYIMTINKNNTRQIKKGTTIKTIIIKDLEFPINKKTRKVGNSLVVTIPKYLINNGLLKQETIIDKITY